MSDTRKNPYVGARTFETKESELFFGREREAADLLSLVISDRLVLFYAQSGAGKSSLINTKLIPGLIEENEFKILPVGRLRRDELAGSETSKANIYIYNLITSLTKRSIDESILDRMSLSEYLELEVGEKKDDQIPWKYILIIDQFEELFTTHEEEWEKREHFFKQLGEVMKKFPRLWVVLVMREDYIAYLDPYAYLLPDRLRTRYYMQRLEKEQAIQAVEGPAGVGEPKRYYAPGVTQRLVSELSNIMVRKPNNTWESQEGQYVEPVQLQVVCSNLWEKLPRHITEITQKELDEHVGEMNKALGIFYQERVQAVANGRKAKEKGIRERDIRKWFEEELIIDGKRRNMVAQEPGGKSGGLDDEIIREFIGNLVREEKRGGGATFYELTHDRMVEPINENNLEWDRANSSPFRAQAEEWGKKFKEGPERADPYLISGQTLIDAEEWKEQHPGELIPLERDFLEACREQQEEIERKLVEEAQSARRLRRFVALVGILALIAVGAAVLAFWFGVQATGAKNILERNLYLVSTEKANTENEKNRANVARATAEASQATAQASEKDAKEQANIALSGNLVAQADSIKNSDYTLALLLGMEAYQRDKNLLTRTTLFQLLQFTPFKREFGFTSPVSSVAVSPDGTVIAVASCTGEKTKQCAKGNIKLYDAYLNEVLGPPLFNHELGPVYTLAFSPDGKTLAAGGCVPEGCAISQGQITFWDVSSPNKPEFLSDISNLRTKNGYIHTALVKTVAFSPDGEWLASGSYDTTIIVWNVRDLSKPSLSTRLIRHFSFVNALAFSPDGKTLVSASDDKHIWLWNFSRQNGDAREAPSGHTAPINSVAFSPDGTKFASGADDNTVLLWNWDANQGLLQENPIKLEEHAGYVKSVVFNDDGTILASTGFDNKIILWNATTGQQIGLPLSLHSGAVNSIAFGSQNLEGKILPYLISGSDDHTVTRWDLSARLSASQPLSQTVPALPNDKQDHGKLKDKLLKAVASEDRTVTLSDVTDISQPDTFLKLEGFNGAITEPYFSRDGKYLYTVEKIGESRRVTQWEIDPDDWLKDMACTAVKQNLTPSIKKRFLDIVPTQSVLKMCDIKLAVPP